MPFEIDVPLLDNSSFVVKDENLSLNQIMPGDR
jgi:hypothetical protein